MKDIVNEYSDVPPAEVANGEGDDDENDGNDEPTTLITLSTRKYIDEPFKTFTKLNLFTDDA